MTTNKHFTKYCSLPPHTVIAGFDNSTFYAVTEAHKVNVTVEPTESEFKYKNCGQRCPYYITPAELSDLIKNEQEKVLPNKTVSYCITNELCNASPILMADCMNGHNLQQPIKIELSLPKLVWVWDFGGKASTAWKVYGITEVSTNGNLKVVPFPLPNVYPEGHICWKKGSRGKGNKLPQDLQQAYYTFFSAEFNNETSLDSVTSIVEYLENFDFDVLIQNQDLQDRIIDIEINNFEQLITDSDYKTLMVTNDSKIISTYPKRVVVESLIEDFLFVKIKKTLNSSVHLLHVNGYACLKTGKLKGSSKPKLLNELLS